MESTLDQVLPQIRWRIVLTDQERHNGTKPPEAYGLAWRDFPRRTNVYMPVPVNVIAGALRAAWHRMRAGYGRSVEDSRFVKAAGDAFDRGWQEGFTHGRTFGQREGHNAALVGLLAHVDNKGRDPH